MVTNGLSNVPCESVQRAIPLREQDQREGASSDTEGPLAEASRSFRDALARVERSDNPKSGCMLRGHF